MVIHILLIFIIIITSKRIIITVVLITVTHCNHFRLTISANDSHRRASHPRLHIPQRRHPSQLTASPNLPFLRRAEDDGGGGGYARGRGRPDGGVEGRPRQQRGCDSPYVCLPTEPRPHRQTDPAQKGRILFLFFLFCFV